MKSILDMDVLHVEITNHCINSCSNCTRLVGHHAKPYYMDVDFAKLAIDSIIDSPKICGIMGGEPLLHQDFEAICDYLHSKLPPSRCGLWTCLPAGFEKYREVITRTFGHIFINDHTRNDVLHCPVLVASKEVITNEAQNWLSNWNCWVQNTWSASINPNGAFFCEVAASMSLAFNIKVGWKVEPGWWLRTPLHYIEQARHFCPNCGCAVPLEKRSSTDIIDDISKGNYERLKDYSPKIKARKYKLHDLKLVKDDRQMAAYKDTRYRDKIAKRYGMFLIVNELGYQTPFLLKNWQQGQEESSFKLNEVNIITA